MIFFRVDISKAKTIRTPSSDEPNRRQGSCTHVLTGPPASAFGWQRVTASLCFFEFWDGDADDKQPDRPSGEAFTRGACAQR
jgi:hypothetical protein